MSDLWQQWIGLTVDNRYALREYLSHTEHSAVFLTDFTDSETRKAAIKFISAEIPEAQQQLDLWQRVAKLRHPSLLPIYDSGRCRITNMDLLYVVMEFAEETLSQLLPNRPLSPPEAQQMLEPVVEGLVFLHRNALAHGHVTPSNVVAAGDALKLTSDTATPIGEMRDPHRQLDIYDAPESAESPVTAAADVWSLGETIVAALTQQTAPLPYNDQADPAVPTTIPQPFLDMATHALRREPKYRWSSAQIANRLNPEMFPAVTREDEVETQQLASVASRQPEPVAVAAAAGAALGSASPSASPAVFEPLNIPLSSEPAVPLSKLSAVPASRAQYEIPRTEIPSESVSDSSWSSYIIPVLLAAGLVLLVVLAVPKLLRHQPAAESAQSVVASRPVATKPAAPPPVTETSTTGVSAAAPTPKSPVPAPSNPLSSQPKTSPASATAKTPAAVASPTPHASSDSSNVVSRDTSSGNQPEVLNEVLPHVPDRALATIHGTVRVVVRVEVDAAGQVSNASLASAGPSPYFANQSLQAARQWQFITPSSDPRPTSWQIHFDYSRSGPTARVTPL